MTCPTPLLPKHPTAAPGGAQSVGCSPLQGCCPLPLPQAAWGAKLGSAAAVAAVPASERGEGQNGSGPAGLGCCSAVRLGLNVLQGGAEVREGDECRKHIK